MRLFSRLIPVSLLTFAATAAFAQTGVVKGFLYDRKTGEPVIYNVVGLSGTSFNVQTDVNGFFSLIGIPAGSYTLTATSFGYDTAKIAVVVAADGIISQNLYIRPAGIQGTQIKEVTVGARRAEQVTQVRVGTTTITPREIKLLPASGGEPDLAQFLQITPGVTFTGDQGGQLYIRGGSPSQTGILLDGVTIYNPFHSIGLYSVFETDAIRSADVITAGFNADYGNRTSAILDVRTKDGNKNRISGKVSGSPVMARVLVEGPLTPRKNEESGGVTFLLTGKHSYLDKTSQSVYGNMGDGFKNGLPFSFTDLYGKVTLSAGNGSKVNLFGFSFDDKASLLNQNSGANIADFNWKAKGGGVTFVLSPGTSSALISGKFAYSQYDAGFTEASRPEFPRTTGISGFEGGIDFTYFLKGYSQLKYGVEVSGQQTTLNYLNTGGIATDYDRRNTLASVYAMYRKNLGQKFILEPGVRVQYYSGLSVISPEPRIGLKYNATRNLRFKAAAGRYTQNIISTKSDRDVVNFFSGFLLSPAESLNDPQGTETSNSLLSALHGVVGVEVDAFGVNFNLEPWYKKFSQVVELNRTKLLPSDPNFQAGNGEAYGIDLSARYNKDRIYLWGAASYQMVNNTFRVLQNNGPAIAQTYPTPFDRRFNLNLLGAYTAGRKRDWEFSARYNLGSPFPFTQTQGFFENVNATANGIGTNIPAQNGSLGIIYADDINGGRLSYYHRLDLNAKKRFTFSQNVNLELTAAVTNAYNRRNIFYVDRVTNERVYQLPFFPSINATLNF